MLVIHLIMVWIVWNFRKMERLGIPFLLKFQVSTLRYIDRI